MALRLPGLRSHLPIRRLLNTPGPASAAPPGKDSGRSAACVPGGASLTRPTTPFIYQKATQHPTPGKRSRRGAACVPGGASLTRPTKSFTYQKATQHPRSGKRRAAGQGQRARCRFCAGWRLRLTRPTTPFTYQKVTQHPRPGKRSRRGAACVPGGGYALPGL